VDMRHAKLFLAYKEY